MRSCCTVFSCLTTLHGVAWYLAQLRSAEGMPRFVEFAASVPYTGCPFWKKKSIYIYWCILGKCSPRSTKLYVLFPVDIYCHRWHPDNSALIYFTILSVSSQQGVKVHKHLQVKLFLRHCLAWCFHRAHFNESNSDDLSNKEHCIPPSERAITLTSAVVYLQVP